jgi:NuA3 HAT complex component NTO1
MDYIAKVNVRKKLEFVQLVCRYWSLKREARRGAPLLKRLHLEPWTASSVGKMQTDEEKVMKLEVRSARHLFLFYFMTLACSFTVPPTLAQGSRSSPDACGAHS